MRLQKQSTPQASLSRALVFLGSLYFSASSPSSTAPVTFQKIILFTTALLFNCHRRPEATPGIWDVMKGRPEIYLCHIHARYCTDDDDYNGVGGTFIVAAALPAASRKYGFIPEFSSTAPPYPFICMLSPESNIPEFSSTSTAPYPYCMYVIPLIKCTETVLYEYVPQ